MSRIIDFHTHCFPEKIAAKALSNLSHCSGDAIPFHAGTADSLLEHALAGGADGAVVLNIATNPRQQESVNHFAIDTNNRFPHLYAFGSIHPESPGALDELERIYAAGLKGIKLHPDYQHFFVDEDRMLPIYEKIASLGLITVFHAGVDIGYPDPVHCAPERLAHILPAFGSAPVVAAHMGGYLCWQDVLKCLVGKPLYFDTAFSFSRMPPDWAREIICAHGANRVLLGSDMPWSDTRHEIRFVKSLGLSSEETKAILGGNACRLLQLQ